MRAKIHLDVRNVVKTFRQRPTGFIVRREGPAFRAVDDVSFSIRRGECFGLVGESGCGKTTLSKVIMRALEADSGEMLYNDRGTKLDVSRAEGEELMRFRRRVQYIFQDPFGSLSPRMTVFDILREPLIIHDIGDADYRAEMAKELMRLVGLDPRFLNRYPHSFSGGQRQRIGIARALALKPDLILCDEPVSALDVSIQAQVLNLLKDLQAELGLTYLFISHNLAVVDYIADEIAVMCRGRIVEIAPREVLFHNPMHPYTLGLLAAVPYPDLDRKLDLDGRARRRRAQAGGMARAVRVDAAECRRARRCRRRASRAHADRPPRPRSHERAHRPHRSAAWRCCHCSPVRRSRSRGAAESRRRRRRRQASTARAAAAARARSSFESPRSDWTLGRYGGEVRTLMAKDRDIRMMVVYGYSRLVGYDEQLRLVARHPRRASTTSTAAIFTLHLRPGHKWSDGQPFTAEDFRYYWDDVAQQQGPVAVRLAAGAARRRPRRRSSKC